MSNPFREIVLIGHPGHKRVTLFQEALSRQGHPPARVVAWRDLLTQRDALVNAIAPDTLIRIESPGQDFEVEKLLLAAGARSHETEDVGATALSAEAALRLPFERGRLHYPRQWYRGFRATLHGLAESSFLRWMSHPEEIATLYDKRICHRLFVEAGLPVPRSLGQIASFRDLRRRMDDAKCRRVFVKLASGSSGSGIVALRVGGTRMTAITTVEMEQGDGAMRLYNTRRIVRHESPADIEILIDALCPEGAHVEEWLPKASYLGDAFDLRVLMIAGEARQIVPRLSQQPMTNLHLLNRRGDLESVRRGAPSDSWEAALETCRRAARLFPRCHHVGIDLLFTPGFRSHALLEANAFGDLLPGALWKGLDTYEAEIASLVSAA